MVLRRTRGSLRAGFEAWGGLVGYWRGLRRVGIVVATRRIDKAVRGYLRGWADAAGDRARRRAKRREGSGGGKELCDALVERDAAMAENSALRAEWDAIISDKDAAIAER